jgi:hypothetical protein
MLLRIGGSPRSSIVLMEDAQHQPGRPALLKDVAAEAAEAGHAVGAVDLLGHDEALLHVRRQHRLGKGGGVGRLQAPLLRDHVQGAADPHQRVAARLEVEIRGSGSDGSRQQIVDVHRQDDNATG